MDGASHLEHRRDCARRRLRKPDPPVEGLRAGSRLSVRWPLSQSQCPRGCLTRSSWAASLPLLSGACPARTCQQACCWSRDGKRRNQPHMFPVCHRPGALNPLSMPVVPLQPLPGPAAACPSVAQSFSCFQHLSLELQTPRLHLRWPSPCWSQALGLAQAQRQRPRTGPPQQLASPSSVPSSPAEQRLAAPHQLVHLQPRDERQGDGDA